MAGEIRVSGLKEFNRNLRKMDKGLPKGLRLAGNEAADIVVRHAKPRVPVGPAKGGHALSSLRASSTRTAARVSGGSKRYPYYAFLDFGGSVGPNNSVHRPYLKRGRYIWPAFVDEKPQVEKTLYRALVAVAHGAGIETS